MAGLSRRRLILEMAHKINSTIMATSEDATFNDQIKTNLSHQDQNESLDFNLPSASQQSPKSKILKGETHSHQIPPPEGDNKTYNLPSTSHSSSCEIMDTDAHTHQLPLPEDANKRFDSNLTTTSHQSPLTSGSDLSSADSDSSSSSGSDSSNKDFSNDDSVKDLNYKQSSSSEVSETPEDATVARPSVTQQLTVTKRKRKADPKTWKKTAAKICRNSGKQYV